MLQKCIHALQLVTFDVTGTLIKFKIPPPKHYAEVGRIYGIHVEPEKLSASFRTSWKEMDTEHPNFGKGSGLGWEKWWHTLVCRTFQLSVGGSVLDNMKLDSVACHLIRDYSSSACYELYPHVNELLQYLLDRGLSLGVISNNDERLPRVLDHIGLLHYFSFVLTSYEVGFEKPHCEIFQKALEYNNVTPEHALHVGNNPSKDYLAAIKCGWNAALVHIDKKIVVQKYPNISQHFLFSNFHDLQMLLSSTF